jgi:transcriptional regulator with XRE-family HTH domain
VTEDKSTMRRRTRPRRLHHEPEAVTWAREKAGLTKRALADIVGVSEQLVGEIGSGWRSATPANLLKIAAALNCPLVVTLDFRKQSAAQSKTAVGGRRRAREWERRADAVGGAAALAGVQGERRECSGVHQVWQAREA